MARIELVDLAHAYRPDPRTDADWALRPLTLQWDDGGAYALLGPSGCGKTTLLNIISGLVAPSRGRVLFDGRDVTRASPRQRNIAQVFQFPVIYDTMTVADNLAFPLRNRGMPAAAVRARVGEVAEMLELSADLDRRAANLTADAKQKISLGRGLVRSDVAAVLFDEPLTVIDPHLKWQLRRKLKQIHQELRLTLVYVTHDQVEALTFADRVVVMDAGRVMQAGTPEELFERPAHAFVGHFIGSPGMNFLPVRVDEGALQVGGHRLSDSFAAEAAIRLTRSAGPFIAKSPDGIELGVRPEYVALVAPGSPGALPATIEHAQDLGTYRMVSARTGGALVRARVPLDAPLPESPWLSVLHANTCFYADGELVP